jgi:hypothetical protein
MRGIADGGQRGVEEVAGEEGEVKVTKARQQAPPLRLRLRLWRKLQRRGKVIDYIIYHICTRAF